MHNCSGFNFSLVRLLTIKRLNVQASQLAYQLWYRGARFGLEFVFGWAINPARIAGQLAQRHTLDDRKLTALKKYRPQPRENYALALRVCFVSARQSGLVSIDTTKYPLICAQLLSLGSEPCPANLSARTRMILSKMGWSASELRVKPSGKGAYSIAHINPTTAEVALFLLGSCSNGISSSCHRYKNYTCAIMCIRYAYTTERPCTFTVTAFFLIFQNMGFFS